MPRNLDPVKFLTRIGVITPLTVTEAFFARCGFLAPMGMIPKPMRHAISSLATLVYRGSVVVVDGAWRGTVHRVWLDDRLGWRCCYLTPYNGSYGFSDGVTVEFWRGKVYESANPDIYKEGSSR